MVLSSPATSTLSVCTSLTELSEEVEGDLFELRLDLFPTLDFEALARFRKKESRPLIFTLRKKSQGGSYGGSYEGSEEEHFQLLNRLAALKPDYLDIEEEINPLLYAELCKRYPTQKWIISHHNFEETPEASLEALLRRMERLSAHFYKIAVKARSTLDALRLLVWLKNSGRDNLIVVSMGEWGEPARILAPFLGAPFAYAYPEEGRATAPGQLTYREYQRYGTFKSPSFYGLIGDPITASVGHIFHNQKMKDLGLEALYVKMRVKEEELAEFFQLARQLGFKGLSVTMPLKEAVIPFVDTLSPEAHACSAVNTLIFEKGELFGYNTDIEGALIPLRKRGPLKGKRALVLGAGGAAKALIYGLKREGARVELIHRNREKGADLAQKWALPFWSLEDLADCFKQPYDLLVNCTPDPSLLPLDYLQKGAIAMDIRSVPPETEWLKVAKDRGMTPVSGYEMFVEQALLQLMLWGAVSHPVQEVPKPSRR